MQKIDYLGWQLFPILIFRKIVYQKVHFYLDFLYIMLDSCTKNLEQT